MSSLINGRRGTRIDSTDRGLQYGDGLFETMALRGGRVRLLTHHLDRLKAGCRRLRIKEPSARLLRREIEKIAVGQDHGVVKLIVTRGVGERGYRPSGDERPTRILSLHALPRASHDAAAVRVRVCATRLGLNPQLAGLKTLNRLESVLARAEWADARIWEGLMRDTEQNIVCGTMTNLFLRRGSTLVTPVLDRCGVAGVMRRWVLESAAAIKLRAVERRVRWQDLAEAEELFLSNAVVGLRSIRVVEFGRRRLYPRAFICAEQLRDRLERL